ncbi:MAG: glycosyltransferase [Actinobacteria bacterium]|nr:glycosyltransferase [Actinomycetota bacterium]
MNVLQVLGRSAGGIARHVAQITEALDGDDLTIDVAGPRDLPVPMPKAVIPLDIPDGPRGHSRIVRRLRSYLRQGGYDVVHAHGLRAGIDAALAARPLEVPTLQTVHNLVLPDVSGRVKAAAYKWAEPLSVRLTQHTFAVSEEIARHLRGRSPKSAGKVEILYLGIGDAPRLKRTPAQIRAEADVPDDARLIVTVSRLSAQKALNVMLSALARLPANVVLIVLGQGPDEQRLKTMSLAMGLGDRVRWLGWRNDIADWIHAADVFSLSSNWEGVPLAAQEAVLLGVPVVSTEVGGMPELIGDRSSGRLVPKGDAEALAAALSDVLSSSEMATRYAEQALVDLRRRFSTSQMLTRLSGAYEWHAR